MKPNVLIVSDLHLGGGSQDPLEDHLEGGFFVRLLDEFKLSEAGQRGDLELVINGDFLEFCQTAPEVFRPRAPHLWCSVEESMIKLETILRGHKSIFEALRQFQEAGQGENRNLVTIAAGNHDVDLYWPEVQQRLQQVIGSVNFELGSVWYERFDGRLQINHGHHFDPANSFKKWDDPFYEGKERRLEMCPGTLFLARFVNHLERRYPFADNIRPYGGLVRLLWLEDPVGLGTMAWLLARFTLRYPDAVHGLRVETSHLNDIRVVDYIHQDDEYAKVVLMALHDRAIEGKCFDLSSLREQLETDEDVHELFFDLLAAGGTEALPPLPSEALTAAGENASGSLFGLMQGARIDLRGVLREKALERAQEVNAEVVVIGHSHLPDEFSEGEMKYYNTGSWIRFLDVTGRDDITLDDLRNEEIYPYELCYVRVWEGEDGRLVSEMERFEKFP